MISQVWYHLYNLKDLKSTHGGVLLLVTDKACNFIKCNIPPWVFFTFLKLCKWYQIAQIISFNEFSSRKAWSVLVLRRSIRGFDLFHWYSVVIYCLFFSDCCICCVSLQTKRSFVCLAAFLSFLIPLYFFH